MIVIKHFLIHHFELFGENTSDLLQVLVKVRVSGEVSESDAPYRHLTSQHVVRCAFHSKIIV